MMPVAATIGDLPAEPPIDMITEPAPATETVTLVKTGLGFIRIENQLDALPSDGSLTKMKRDGDKIYLGDIFSWAKTPGWIEGTVEDGVATFRFPQLVKDEILDVQGVLTPYQYYAVACEMEVRGGSADMVPTPEQTYSFTISADGALIPEDPDLFIGNFLFLNQNWEWNLDGDFYTALAPQEAAPVQLPEDVKLSHMVLTYPHLLYGGTYAKEVKFGIDGNDCWLRGMAVGISDLKEATIKGTREGDVVRFDSDQFLGDSWLFGFTQYMVTGETEFIEDPQYGYRPQFTPVSPLEFVYDETAGTLSSDMSFVIVPALQDDPENLYYENIYTSPVIYSYDPAASVKKLVAPVINGFSEASDGMPNVLDFSISMISSENIPLDMSRLYFEIQIDGAPFEFTPAIDPALKEPATLIPFGTTDYYCFVAQEEIVQMVAIPESESIDSLALRLVYLADEENPVYSDLIYAKGNPDGVEGIEGDADTVRVEYTDLQGRRVDSPADGIFVRRSIKSDGTSTYRKVILR